MDNKQQDIHSKGFDMSGQQIVDNSLEFNKIKVGVKQLEDAVLLLGSAKKVDSRFGDKFFILRCIARRDYKTLREISRYYYSINGLYRTACDYIATLYRYDWYVEPETYDVTIANNKVLKDFGIILTYLDRSRVRKMCGDIALNVVLDGAYYGYSIDSKDKVVLQQLPINYCRSRYSVGDNPAVEFNMRYFDDTFHDIEYRLKVLKMFPEEFQKGYILYKKGKLKNDAEDGAYSGWFLLDPEKCVKFTMSIDDMPLFINTIPLLLDLDAAQDLDRRKQMQQLLKILIQKLPRDKNGDLIFDVDEARDIHNNAVKMISHAVGVDVLTTFADVQVEDMADSNTSTTADDLEKVERSVYNSLGISQSLFNADGNTTVTNSILTDESSTRKLVFQFESFFDRLVQERNPNKKKYKFKFQMLETTQFNYRELSKYYKEHTQLGFSKMLPQIALGHTQNQILNSAFFENEILHLNEIMIPPLSSNVMSAETVLAQKETRGSSSEGGRPEKPDEQKSDKTLANREAMS